jgi:hypothetical protein
LTVLLMGGPGACLAVHEPSCSGPCRCQATASWARPTTPPWSGAVREVRRSSVTCHALVRNGLQDEAPRATVGRKGAKAGQIYLIARAGELVEHSKGAGRASPSLLVGCQGPTAPPPFRTRGSLTDMDPGWCKANSAAEFNHGQTTC